jgi:hypothetical protein
MKETFYFSHDYNARSDEKIQSLRRKYGFQGYGIYWAIVEDLYNNENALRTDYEGIAYEYRVDEEMIKSIINDFNLFIIDNGVFGSLSIQRRLDERNKKSIKARESAHKRWGDYKNNANALRTHCERIAIKDSIEKEKKEKDISAFNFLAENAPQELDTLLNKFGSLRAARPRIIEFFNSKVAVENIEYDSKKLIGRLNIILMNWDKNEKPMPVQHFR